MHWKVEFYAEDGGYEPFRDWLDHLRDMGAKERILKRLRRLAEGNPGDNRSVGHGICELKIDYGPGYRLYYARRGATWVILLCGGDKSSQRRDIVRAYWYWEDYRRRYE